MCLGSMGRIERTWDEGGVPMAMVAGSPVCLVYTPEVVPGQMVLVHLGFAVEVIDEARARDAIELREAWTAHTNQKETA